MRGGTAKKRITANKEKASQATAFTVYKVSPELLCKVKTKQKSVAGYFFFKTTC
jgi:hypothetical protein